jgi:hypothetical protein
MRYLVTIRAPPRRALTPARQQHKTARSVVTGTTGNKLVHDRDVNAIPDRAAFVDGWNEVEGQLKAMLPDASASSCIVC